MKKKSLCFQVTLTTALILFLCAALLTFFSSYHAGRQFVAVAAKISTVQPAGSESEPGPGGDITFSVPTESITSVARRQFNLAGIGAMFAIAALSTGLVYLTTRRALSPIHEFSQTVSAITENDLDIHLQESAGSSSEAELLHHSFNTMMERLERSFSAQKLFAENAAHELKNPLATIIATAQVSRLSPPSPAEYMHVLSSIEANAKRMQGTLEGLLRLCGGQAEFETGEVRLEDLFANILREAGPRMREMNVSACVDCSALPAVSGNYELLYRAFYNLIENAVKYNRPGGEIRITSRVLGGRGEIVISDSGYGIEPGALPRIFEPFYREGAQRSRKTEGSGLGLSIVKSIIERHGWDISAESAPGQGTSFTISLFL